MSKTMAPKTAGILLATLIAGSLSPLSASEEGIPNFMPDEKTAWLAPDDDFLLPETGPGPVVSDPAYPYISFYRHPRNEHPTFRVADLNNVILQDWTKAELRKANGIALSGKIVSTLKERCWPVGVPAFSLLPSTGIRFLQTAKQVTIIWPQDHQVRRVYLDMPHSANLKPTWLGESVGHYEGDTLVVDTIGLNDKTYVDNYFTPHTDKLHVIERYHLIDGGRTLEVDIRVEDPGAFTRPWSAMQRYRKVDQGEMAESVCAENNGDHFDQDPGPMPIAGKADF
jgi:hypothetical protein